MTSSGRRPTWKVLRWDRDIGDRHPSEIEFRCSHCGWDAYCLTRGDPQDPVSEVVALLARSPLCVGCGSARDRPRETSFPWNGPFKIVTSLINRTGAN